MGLNADLSQAEPRIISNDQVVHVKKNSLTFSLIIAVIAKFAVQIFYYR